MLKRESTYNEKLALQFIEDIKEEYLFFLYKTFHFFPYCCDIASQILLSYIQSRYGVGKIEAGYYGKPSEFHTWGRINDVIVDFTFVQFLKDEDTIFELSKNKDQHSLYKELVTNHYSSHCLPSEHTKHIYKLDEINPIFVKIANQSDYFTHFLEQFNEDNLTELLLMNNDEFNKSKLLNI